MTEPTPKTTMDTLEDVPHIDPDPGKIHEQAEKQAANIDGLISLLQTGGLLERTKAADILGEIRDKRGVMPLIGTMNDPSTDVQYVAIKSLGMIADPRATEPLTNALKSGEKWVRLGAARSLGQIDMRISHPVK
jgi:HEAT repeat protein